MNRSLLAVLVLAACGPQSQTQQPPPGSQPSAQQSAAASSAGQALTSTTQSVAATSSFVDLSQGVNSDRPASGIATDISTHAQGDGGGCAMISYANTTVTADFGAPPGCTLRNGVVVSGKASVGVAKSATQVSLSFTYDALNVNGKQLDGTASYSVREMHGYSVDLNLTSGTNAIAGNVTLQANAGAVTIDGMVHTATPGATDVAYQAVGWKLGDCYPSSGSVDVVQGNIELTMTFDAQTPSTGKVTVTSGQLTWHQTLPSFGLCRPEP